MKRAEMEELLEQLLTEERWRSYWIEQTKFWLKEAKASRVIGLRSAAAIDLKTAARNRVRANKAAEMASVTKAKLLEACHD